MKDQAETAKLIFGDYGYQIPLIRDLVSRLEPFTYYFMPDDAFLELLQEATDPYESQSIYCSEILQRAHLAAIVSLVRADRWLNGVIHGFVTENLFVFAAALRGFLESSADTHYVLAPVPRDFSEKAEMLQKCLTKIPRTELYLFPELEDRLIHFSHGRKIGKSEHAPESHRAKTMRYYIDYLQEHGDAGLHDFYSEMCEITHPAADSVLCMLDTTDGSNIQFNKNFDGVYMLHLLTRYRASTDWLFAQCISPALMTLGLIIMMNLPELKTEALDRIDLKKVGKWIEFRDKVASAFST